MTWLLCASACTGRAPGIIQLTEPLSYRQLEQCRQNTLWEAYRESEESVALARELDSGEIAIGEDRMPVSVELFWDEASPMPEAGYPVYISLHGGGAFTPAENQEQWQIQQQRYPDVQGLYICPRSARDTWDHWHEAHMVALIDRLIRAVLLRSDIDPDRIYLTGYCSGGNGVYQLAPIMADRFAAASATKALSEGAPLDNLRNCPIDLQWGQADPDPIGRPAHNRANVDTLYRLHNADRAGYSFREIEHWRQGRFVNDKSTIAWLARFSRDPSPDRVVWVQDGEQRASSNPLRHQFYYLALDESYRRDGIQDRATAQLLPQRNAVALAVSGYDHIILRLNSQMLDLDQPLTVELNGEEVFRGRVEPDPQVMQRTLEERGDRSYIYSAELRLVVPD